MWIGRTRNRVGAQAAASFVLAALGLTSCSGTTSTDAGGETPGVVIRPVVGPDTIFHVGSSFRLQLLDSLGNGVQPGSRTITFNSSDATVLGVTTDGWAEALGEGSAVVTATYGQAVVRQRFVVDSTAVVTGPSIEIRGTYAECGESGLADCQPLWSPMVDGRIGHLYESEGVTVDFRGTAFQSGDFVFAGPKYSVPCQNANLCVTAGPGSGSPNAWQGGQLCVSVFVGDSVPDYGDPNGTWRTPQENRWEIRWSRNGPDQQAIFDIRQEFFVFVQPFRFPPEGLPCN